VTVTRDPRLTLAALSLSLGLGCTDLKRFAYEGFGRDRWQHADQVVRALDIQPGSRVADLGAGGGYFTFRLADAVGPEGIVYAVDIDDGMIRYLERRARREGRANVRTILAAPDDPRLPAGGVDLVFTCNTYHHLGDRVTYFARLRESLRPDGRVAIIDSTGVGLFHRLFGHATPADTIRREMEAAGYRLEVPHDFLDRQSFLVFAPAEG
jgi:predicted methyltransferase